MVNPTCHINQVKILFRFSLIHAILIKNCLETDLTDMQKYYSKVINFKILVIGLSIRSLENN